MNNSLDKSSAAVLSMEPSTEVEAALLQPVDLSFFKDPEQVKARSDAYEARARRAAHGEKVEGCESMNAKSEVSEAILAQPVDLSFFRDTQQVKARSDAYEAKVRAKAANLYP